ncbi:hypothetical protein [Micromonospora sp. NPDC005206]|uniref:hypothetical protein n=2 Tax=unclassified Micromonospora TaxID=2617518 RepID=UPI0033B676D8
MVVDAADDANNPGAHDDRMAAVEAWFLGGPVDGRLMPVEVTADGSPPAVVKLPQTGIYVGPSDFPTPTVEQVYVLADRFDDVEVYQYRQPASEATD